MVDLFNYEEKTHIVIEYFKYQPFIVRLLIRLSLKNNIISAFETIN